MAMPFLLPFDGTSPVFKGQPAFVGLRAAVLGRARLGRDAYLGTDCVIRADGNDVTIGNDVFLGPRTTVHIVHATLSTHVGDSVTAGANAVIHACRVGDNCLIERDAVILDGAVVEPGVLVEAGSTVLPRKTLVSGWIYEGSPARAVRLLERHELVDRTQATRSWPDEPGTWSPPLNTPSAGAFLAATARTVGDVLMGRGSSLLFSCIADAGDRKVRIGENTNVQDNTIIVARTGDVTIGANSTIGHNVNLGSCVIGGRCLVGMGVTIAEGTVVEDDVFIAAGACTEPGQVLRSNYLWVGRPARPLSPLDTTKRGIISTVVETYRSYAVEFDRLQKEAGASRL